MYKDIPWTYQFYEERWQYL